MAIGEVTTAGTRVTPGHGEPCQVPLIGLTADTLSPDREAELEAAVKSDDPDWVGLAMRWGVVCALPRLGGTLWIDGHRDVTGDHLIHVVKQLRSSVSDGARILVLSGEVRIRPEHDYDSVGALAAAIIRLRVDQWVGVGLAVKALSTQVGLEGSWDGESLWWELPGDAYDYLRAWPHLHDVVLVSGVGSSEVQAIVDLIEADSQ